MNCSFLSFRALSLLGLLSIFTIGCQKDDDYIENSIPDVNAGQNQVLDVYETELSGTATDKDGQVVAYLWSQVSGPSESVIVNPGSPKTAVKGLQNGTYVFQLMATDNKGAVSVTTVSVKVEGIQSLTIQPTNNQFEYKLALQGGVSSATGGHKDMPIEAWTDGGSLTTRIVTKFDLSNIPANATIVSAKLFLYSHPAPLINGNFTDANHGTLNSFVVQRLTSAFNPAGFNWNNQPAVSTDNQVVVAGTEDKFKDLELDVKGMVSSMVTANNNHGFYFKLENEVAYNCRIFVSSFSTSHPGLRPKLVITYK